MASIYSKASFAQELKRIFGPEWSRELSGRATELAKSLNSRNLNRVTWLLAQTIRREP